MNQELQIITKQQAIKLKEVGFDWDADGCYWTDSEKLEMRSYDPDNFNNSPNSYSAANISVVFKWLRDKHNIVCEIQLDQTSYIKYAIEATKFIQVGDFEKIKTHDGGGYLYRTYE